MPVYVYSLKDESDSIERMYPIGCAPRWIRRNGKRYHLNIAGMHRGFRDVNSCWPMVSYAMGVNRDQITAAMEHDARMGVPTRYTKRGNPIIESPSHHRRYKIANHFFDLDSWGTRGDAPKTGTFNPEDF